ncbi:hypothetical protein IFO69_10315 [Echinicola sp. CAU 1574]|uniref:Uncharacterized protein n=1 Tax=Echinicola arenosa TaxID=2774144 RepID=A0ABR9AMP9_9BACT|nr:hypothetical protein [Echinicola arenosa]MBD8489138.1 hypothetical protein [Echinicola arenosa]
METIVLFDLGFHDVNLQFYLAVRQASYKLSKGCMVTGIIADNQIV